MGEDRTGLKTEALVAVLVGFHNHAADDVARHEIGGELNTRITQFENARKSTKQRRFAEAGNPFEQHMTARNHANQNAVNDIGLADNDLANLFPHTVQIFRGTMDDRQIGGKCFSHFPFSQTAVSVNDATNNYEPDGNTMWLGLTPRRSQSAI